MRLTQEQEHTLFLQKCKKENIEPTKELFERFQHMVMARQQIIMSETYQSRQKEQERIKQRTITQTIEEDGAILSPLDDKHYTSKRSWDDHVKAHNVVEIGNENKNKRKKKEILA